jgi:hypothetical protein
MLNMALLDHVKGKQLQKELDNVCLFEMRKIQRLVLDGVAHQDNACE